jgi:hypothetical protein
MTLELRGVPCIPGHENLCYVLKSVLPLENGHDRYRLLHSRVRVRLGVPPVRSQNLLGACCCSSCFAMERLSSKRGTVHPAAWLRNAQRDYHLPRPCSAFACTIYDPTATTKIKSCCIPSICLPQNKLFPSAPRERSQPQSRQASRSFEVRARTNRVTNFQG